jgi:hypothetical protein
MGYVGNASRVVYRGTDAHIHEIWLSATGWQHDDLDELAFYDPNRSSEDAIAAWSDPMGSSTNTSRVVYAGTVGILGGPAIGELWLSRQGIWVANSISNIGRPPYPAGRPFGYLSNVPRVVYRDTGGHIQELSHVSS